MKKKTEKKKKYNAKNLYKYFAEHDRYYEVSEVNENTIDVSIEWGDWKHDHGYCDYLMEQIGYVRTAERLTEEDGSDTYSSIHRYVFKN